jgi:hypothetical protein
MLTVKYSILILSISLVKTKQYMKIGYLVFIVNYLSKITLSSIIFHTLEIGPSVNRKLTVFHNCYFLNSEAI